MTTPWDREQRRAKWLTPLVFLLFWLLVGGLCLAVALAFGSHWEDGRRRPGEAPVRSAS